MKKGDLLDDYMAFLMGVEHEVAKSIGGVGERPNDLLHAILSNTRDKMSWLEHLSPAD
jgi:hypothetical protein